MNAALFLGVAAAGGAGAVLRFLIDRAVTARAKTSYPWGITIVNLSGSLLIGVLAGLAQSSLFAPRGSRC